MLQGLGENSPKPSEGVSSNTGKYVEVAGKKKWLVSDLLHGGGVSACGRAANAAAAE